MIAFIAARVNPSFALVSVDLRFRVSGWGSQDGLAIRRQEVSEVRLMMLTSAFRVMPLDQDGRPDRRPV